jgi:hypothetical protein
VPDSQTTGDVSFASINNISSDSLNKKKYWPSGVKKKKKQFNIFGSFLKVIALFIFKFNLNKIKEFIF